MVVYVFNPGRERDRQISEFEASLVYRVNSKTARATQKNHVLKNKNKTKKTKKKKKKNKKKKKKKKTKKKKKKNIKNKKKKHQKNKKKKKKKKKNAKKQNKQKNVKIILEIIDLFSNRTAIESFPVIIIIIINLQ